LEVDPEQIELIYTLLYEYQFPLTEVNLGEFTQELQGDSEQMIDTVLENLKTTPEARELYSAH